MTTDWIVQLVYASVVAAFGFFLMWRSQVAVRQRAARLASGTTLGDGPDLTEKLRRLVELKAEVTRLEREIGTVSGSSPVPTGAP